MIEKIIAFLLSFVRMKKLKHLIQKYAWIIYPLFALFLFLLDLSIFSILQLLTLSFAAFFIAASFHSRENRIKILRVTRLFPLFCGAGYLTIYLPYSMTLFALLGLMFFGFTAIIYDNRENFKAALDELKISLNLKQVELIREISETLSKKNLFLDS